MTRFSQADLERLGLKENKDGSFSKGSPKTQLKPKKTANNDVFFKHLHLLDVFKMAEEGKYIFIPGNVPSLKNSKQLFKNKHTGKTFISSSQLCKDYIVSSKIHYGLFKARFIQMIDGKDKPYKIEFTFIRDSHRKFDYINVSQIVLDLMVQNGWIVDDNNTEIIPVFSDYGYDPKLPGVIIKVK